MSHNKHLRKSVLKTIAAFLNSEGGRLLIGELVVSPMRLSTTHALPCFLLVLAGLAAARPVDGKAVPSASELVDRSIAAPGTPTVTTVTDVLQELSGPARPGTVFNP